MREAIQQYVEREEKREALRQEAISAWNEYRATGLHVTQEESDAWLARLEAGDDAEPPERHACSGRRPRCAMCSDFTASWPGRKPMPRRAP